jgi:hypothetical protein
MPESAGSALLSGLLEPPACASGAACRYFVPLALVRIETITQTAAHRARRQPITAVVFVTADHGVRHWPVCRTGLRDRQARKMITSLNVVPSTCRP